MKGRKENLAQERELLLDIYRRLLAHFGPRRWWPAQTPFEVMVGAILTQNTAWANVEKAIANLKAEGPLRPSVLIKLSPAKLRRLIRPSGYFNQKEKKLRAFLRFFLAAPYRGSVGRMRRAETGKLREELLSIWGIGPETADSILLYALEKPVFVVDAYTRRVFARLGLTPAHAGYQELQNFFVRRLPKEIALFNDFHAQVVALGNRYCRSRPDCGSCPLQELGRCRVFGTGPAI
jgi:endonuclease-3 related protein